MDNTLPALFGPLSLQVAGDALLACNDATAQYGLTLTPQEALAVAAAQQKAVADSYRLEISPPPLPLLAMAFCDSPFIDRRIYADTLAELCDIFYYFKNESRDEWSDEELVHMMEKAFNGPCQGSLELLRHRELEKEAAALRGVSAHEVPDEEEDDDAPQ